MYILQNMLIDMEGKKKGEISYLQFLDLNSYEDGDSIYWDGEHWARNMLVAGKSVMLFWQWLN